jgi:hypothetical protein
MGSGAWTNTVFEDHDAVGNVIAVRRSAPGMSTLMMDATFRGAGRPKQRRLILGGGPTELLRQYDYDDVETGIGRLNEMKVFSGGTLVAGSHLTFDGLLRTSEQHLGIANGERFTNWSYDDRGRLTGMVAATTARATVPQNGAPASVVPSLTDADFMSVLTRTPATSSTVSAVQFTPDTGHKIAAITRGTNTESILYQKADGTPGGSQRTEDAKFRYEWDERGNRRRVTEKIIGLSQSTLTRVVYSYNANDRMVGRRVETAPIVSGAAPPKPTGSSRRAAPNQTRCRHRSRWCGTRSRINSPPSSKRKNTRAHK